MAGVILYNYKTYILKRGEQSLRDKSFIIGAWIDFSKPIDAQINDYISSQDAEVMIQLYDRKGNLLGRSGSFKDSLDLPKEATSAVEKLDGPYLYKYPEKDYIIVVGNLFDNDQRRGFVQIFQSEKSILDNYHYLFRIILITSIISIIIAFIAGSFLVSQMLRPINKIVSMVDKMQAEKLDSARLPILNPHDEIGRLSNTINDLLNRIQNAMVNQRKFISDAAHELRTPLTILKGNTEVALIKKSSDSPILTKNLNEINHLISLTNDLLLIARFDSQVRVALKESFNFSNLLNDTVGNFQTKANAKSISIDTNVEKNIMIYADAALMKRVIYNIMDNAFKYSPHKSTILVSLQKNNKNEFRLLIHDEGHGIPKDKIDQIFTRFYRVAEDRNKEIEGTGLGLAIVKSILEEHHFQIQVESELNHGSSFSIYGKISI
jgi:signal transduction histidine kinase